MDKITAIIAAAGKGQRMNRGINKQFIILKGKPVLMHTLEVFDNHPLVEKIVIVTGKDEIKFCQENILKRFNFQKRIKVVAGGKERQDSVYNGLQEVNESGLVIIHDGARPFLTKDMISSLSVSAKKYGAAIIGVPVKDTVKIVDEEQFVQGTPDRRTLWLIQTPQCFKREVILKAHEVAKSEGFYGTDDASLVERIGIKVKILTGSYENIKITTPEDLIIGENILKGRNQV